MTIGAKIYHKLFCKRVGQDYLGNIYYISDKKNSNGKNRRSVWYKGAIEPSKIPPMWHAWLHYTTDDFPKENNKYSWQIDHIVNLTGTAFSYRPKGHILSNRKRDSVSADYTSWQPE